MSRWKLAGHPSSPMGDVIQWNWPLPGMVKAVSFCESSSNCICQNPEDWIKSRMGLLGCPASFQCLMEGVLRNISNVIVYINDLLIHTKTHEEHIRVLEQVLES